MRHIKIGLLGEHLACKKLVSLGHSIVQRNFRTRFGELDIITRKGKKVFFIEVKTESSKNRGQITFSDRISTIKLIRLKKTSDIFLYNHPDVLFEHVACFVSLDLFRKKVSFLIMRNIL